MPKTGEATPQAVTVANAEPSEYGLISVLLIAAFLQRIRLTIASAGSEGTTKAYHGIFDESVMVAAFTFGRFLVARSRHGSELRIGGHLDMSCVWTFL